MEDSSIHLTYTILVAEDDELIREIIGCTLEEIDLPGIRVEFVKDGLDAFRKLYSNSYDLFITDYNMPKMNGESLLEIWRLKMFPNHCPTILMITGDAQAINELSTHDDGLFTLIKPFDTNRLNKLLKLILSSKKLQKISNSTGII